MMDVGAAGRSGFSSTASVEARPAPPQEHFDAALAALKEKEAARLKTKAEDPSEGGGLFLENLKERGGLADLDKMRLEANSFCGEPEAATLAERCREALDALEAGNGGERERETLRRAYGELVRATEGEHGHLPHDDLTRILAMAEYAQKMGGFEE